MCVQDMALSLLHRVPMLRKTAQTVNYKYNQIKSGNLFVKLILSVVELCFYLCCKLIGQIQSYDYKKYLCQLNNYLYVVVTQYATPVLWSQTKENYKRAKQLCLDAGYALMGYFDDLMSGLNSIDSSSAAVNFDAPNMNTLIDLITRSLAELKLKENTGLEQGYEPEYREAGTEKICSCTCDKHQNKNNMDVLPNIEYSNKPPSTSEHQSVEATSPAHENIMADTRPDETDCTHYEWRKFFPSSKPLIELLSEEKAFELAEALREKRQDKTGRDAYEVDTVLVLLSQWNVIDEKSKHYAVDRANLLYLAICYGWSYALQQITPTTTAPIVTPVVTHINASAAGITSEHVILQRQNSHDGLSNNGTQTCVKKLRKNSVISKSQSSVYSNDSGNSGRYQQDYYNYNAYFTRPNFTNNTSQFRRSFPPNKYINAHYSSNANFSYNKQ